MLMNKFNKSGGVTLPTDKDAVSETLTLMERFGADALRDCDGTEFPAELQNVGSKVYATYYTTRKDNEWAKNNPDEIQQCYIMTGFASTANGKLRIELMRGISPELMKVNDSDDIKRWWEVIDRTADEVVPADGWSYSDGYVTVSEPKEFHEYTVSFLAYLIWDPVHMYNAVVNGWTDVEHQITFDVRQPKTREYSLKRLRRFIDSHPYVDVIRFTTFFHQFSLVFDDLRREKYVDWYGYSASVSPYILERFEKEAGYRFRPEFIIDQGYYNNQYRVPSKEFLDFRAFQTREVAELASQFVRIVHEHGKEAMMFIGDHWIGTEPYMEHFSSIGLDAVVGSVGNGATLRLISDIKGVGYTEGRLLPYFFPDTFNPNGNPVAEAMENWISARRALLRSPLDRIGYGGYLKLACEFPDFLDYVEKCCDEFRALKRQLSYGHPFSHKRVAVLNCWGASRSWGCHMVHHARYFKRNRSYSGVIESLASAPLDVSFISFEEVERDPSALADIDVVINIGDGDTAHTGGAWWEKPVITQALRSFVYNGGGFIGVGEPSGHQYGGHYFQLSQMLGVEKETGFTLGYAKYNWNENIDHFILKDCSRTPDFGEGARWVYPLEGAQVLVSSEQEVQLAVNGYGAGRAVYFSGLPYSAENSRLLLRAILWSAKAEANTKLWFSSNCNVDIHAYPDAGTYCIVNNTLEQQLSVICSRRAAPYTVTLDPGEMRWCRESIPKEAENEAAQ